MSNKVTYIFVAEDRFTAVAAKIAKSMETVDEAIRGVSKGLEGINFTDFPRMRDEIKDINSKLETLVAKVNNTSKSLKKIGKASVESTTGIKKQLEKVAVFSEKMTMMADKFGMMAYFQLMNIEFPMAILVKLGSEYAEAMDNARDSIGIIFDKTKGYQAFQANITQMAERFGHLTRFSAAQVMSVASLIANMTNNMQSVQIAVPAILKYAVGTGQAANLQGAARQFMSGVLSGRLPRANIILTGGSPFERFKQAIDEINKKYMGILVKDSESASAQFAMMNNSLKELASIVFNALVPAFKTFNKILSAIVPRFAHFIETHKTLIKVIGELAVVATGFLVTLVGLGAVFGALVLPLHLVKLGVMALGIAIDATPLAWIISGIFLLITLLTELALHFDKVKEAATAAWGWVGKGAQWASRKLISGGEFIHEHLHTLAPTDQNIHMWLHIKDKGENVSAVRTQSTHTVKTHVDLGTNMGMP